MRPQARYENKYSFYGKQFGAWLGAACYWAYGSLSRHWPQNGQEWTLFFLEVIPFAVGGGIAAHGANRIPE